MAHGYLYASYLYRQIWLVALSKEEVAYCKPHSMRHYYGSRLLYAGVSENDVADWMGHSSTDVLREHYHHIFEGAEQRGRAAIASMVTPGADAPPKGRQKPPDRAHANGPRQSAGGRCVCAGERQFPAQCQSRIPPA
ncbi:hypothetical protein A7J05_21635 [Streptomyces alfalfae]|uniref:Tyr recombinase domain-containing protein n=1 Tax=Streptomyces alfalfae TaxID=1642299 RepID=A0ABM6GVC4_9ACTN|nr:hypothetical protein A7J05_21635 [Streptomyces alfalfae]